MYLHNEALVVVSEFAVVMATKGHTETAVSNIKERRLQEFISVYIA